VQHEGDALGRVQGIEDDQHRESDRFGQDRFVLGVGNLRGGF
jgi:hypothetical protein